MDSAHEDQVMRVFVPMNDEWFTDPRFAQEALVPYRCGVRLLPQLVPRRDDRGATIWEMSAPPTEAMA